MPDLKITLTRSPIGYSETQKRTVKALGLNKMHQTVVRPDNDAIRGMIKAIEHMLHVEAGEEKKSKKKSK
jgi:large subunit ribosomal protein L30